VHLIGSVLILEDSHHSQSYQQCLQFHRWISIFFWFIHYVSLCIWFIGIYIYNQIYIYIVISYIYIYPSYIHVQYPLYIQCVSLCYQVLSPLQNLSDSHPMAARPNFPKMRTVARPAYFWSENVGFTQKITENHQ
jgi:hypothetical protein